MPPVVVLPVLYPFVGIPFGFVTLSWLTFNTISRAVRSARLRLFLSMALVAAVIASGVAVYYRIAVSGTSVANYLPATRLPLISGTGMAALLCYAVFRKRFADVLRLPTALLAAAPLFAVNTQVLTGFIQTPHSFEQNFGVLAFATVAVLGLRSVLRPSWAMPLLFACSCWLLTVYAKQVFAVNASVWQRMPPSSELLRSLRETPEAVIISDPDLADIYGLAAPALHFSALARSQTALFEPLLTERRFDNYMCVKQRVSGSFLAAAVPAETFSTLDRSFQYMNQDVLLTHLNRTHAFRQYFDPAKSGAACVPRDLKVFPAFELADRVTGERISRRLAAVNGSELQPQPLRIVTPRAQWAYAATAELTELVSPRVSRLALVRIEATVTQGCIGFGALEPGQRAFANEVFVNASSKNSQTDVTFRPAAQPHHLVVRNCAPAGSSQVTIGGIDMFAVKGVTVNTVPAAARTFSR